MSADEDTELRDLVAQTLEANGVLGKIRAQLRASVFLALEDQETVENKTPFLNKDLKKFLTTKDGQVAVSLVREFLQFFNLDFTAATLEPETGFTDFGSRESIARDLNIIESAATKKSPLICELLKRNSSEETGRPKSANSAEECEDFIRIPKDLTSQQIADAKEKFNFYDKDKSGTIEKDELRCLFADMFPGFHRNMLERYVNDEFRSVDKDFSNAIDFDEFLNMYKRLFILCKSVVSHDVSDIVPSSPRGSMSSATPSKIPGPVKKTNGWEKTKKDSNRSSFSEDDDAFFDDLIPSNNRAKSLTKTAKEAKPSQIPKPSPSSDKTKPQDKDKPGQVKSPQVTKTGGTSGNSGLSSLQGLPSLTDNKSSFSLKDAPSLPGMNGSKKDAKEDKIDKDIKDIDKKMADLGFDVPDDDYEDDFLSSGRSETLSARSEKSKSQSIAEEIEEEIEEDISLENDDDLTTDRTISIGGDVGTDYIEDVLSF